ncbi:hypothetical protein GLAREA_11024 [Glarea lozoyensis ATCC 20868]|uniref:Extracellular membrane protein CFEM domain-containing protein n=1 Tax=Glarea lozoyensis (strain ATCC 20868 / MF5171) TaxID=1116229 RepID=S3DC92_GLAL2|nr:uncharacterized protein GLAREA_11024 [Glarea lozoyensis ATCC 20868]EPE35325.1 hypothetical protein GLAREA_11024 [Glarea lozoyensis ATCC 20868]
MPSTLYSLLVLALALSQAVSQSIYIDRVREYGSLPCCAQIPVSYVVRNMRNGCGDNNALTSYNCFCTSSSSFFRSLISTEVVTGCPGNDTAAEQAVNVFSRYCAVGATGSQTPLGVSAVRTTCRASTSSVATPAASPASTQARLTSTLAASPTTSLPPPANSSEGLGSVKVVDVFLMVMFLVLAVACVY